MLKHFKLDENTQPNSLYTDQKPKEQIPKMLFAKFPTLQDLSANLVLTIGYMTN